MIGRYIDQLTVAYPAQITLMQNTVDLLMPYAMIGAGVWAVWQLLRMFDRWIDRSEARRLAKAREPQYRTADGEQIRRDIEQLWRSTPDASGASWEPWRDTIPPAQPTQRHRVRAGSPKVVAFPSAGVDRRRQS